MSRKDIWCVVRRRAADADIKPDWLSHLLRDRHNGLPGETARVSKSRNARPDIQMLKPPVFMNRRIDDISVGEVERIGI